MDNGLKEIVIISELDTAKDLSAALKLAEGMNLSPSSLEARTVYFRGRGETRGCLFMQSDIRKACIVQKPDSEHYGVCTYRPI